jgi:hypothetical protein
VFGVTRPKCPAKHLPEEMRKKVGVCGGRDFDEYELLFRKMEKYTLELDDPIIVTGGQRKRVERNGELVYIGADYFAEQWAGWNWYLTRIFYPDKKFPSPQRFHIRNRKIIEHIDYLVAFWDGLSPGTKSMIDMAKERKIPLRIVRY